MAKFTSRLAASAARCSDAGQLRLGALLGGASGRKSMECVCVCAGVSEVGTGIGFCGKNLPMNLTR